jgi:hypothetical protein
VNDKDAVVKELWKRIHDLSVEINWLRGKMRCDGCEDNREEANEHCDGCRRSAMCKPDLYR